MTSDHLTNYCREKLSKPFKYLYFSRAVFIFYNLETKKILSRWISATRTSSLSSCSAPRRTPPMTATSSCTTFSSGEYYAVLTDYDVFILFICQTIFVFLVKRGLIRDLKPVNTHCVNSLKCWVSGVWPGDLTSLCPPSLVLAVNILQPVSVSHFVRTNFTLIPSIANIFSAPKKSLLML